MLMNLIYVIQKYPAKFKPTGGARGKVRITQMHFVSVGVVWHVHRFEI